MKATTVSLLVAAIAFLAVGCTPTQQGAARGAAAGAALGAIIADGDDHLKGAAIGAGVGAVTGAAVSKKKQQRSSPYYY